MPTPLSEVYVPLLASSSSIQDFPSNDLQAIQHHGRKWKKLEVISNPMTGYSLLTLGAGAILLTVCNNPERAGCSDNKKMIGQIMVGAGSSLMLFFACCCIKFRYTVTDSSEGTTHRINVC